MYNSNIIVNLKQKKLIRIFLNDTKKLLKNEKQNFNTKLCKIDNNKKEVG